MKLKNLLFFVILIATSAVVTYSQKTTAPNQQAIKSSPAYAELILRKLELESDIDSFLESYTEEFPKVKAARYELDLVQKDLNRLLLQTDMSRLSQAVGKILVRRNEVETELWMLQNQYGKDHPQVKRARRKALNYQNAVKEILP